MELCKFEKEIGALIEASKNFKEFMFEMRDNHLKTIYEKMDCIIKKMSSRRPPWSTLWIISTLTGLCGILITALLMGK